MKILPSGLLLVAALAAALVIVFSSSISRGLDYARDIERQSGLTLMPALVLLTAVFFFHRYRRNHQHRATAQAAELATRDADHRAEELERLVAFGQALGRAIDFETIRVAVSQHLPAIAGTDKVWVLVQEGSEWLALTGDPRGAENILQTGDLAEQLLASAPPSSTDGVDPKTPRDPERAVGFPLPGQVIGV